MTWTMIKRIPRAIKMFYLVYSLHRSRLWDKEAFHIALGYFKLALVWS